MKKEALFIFGVLFLLFCSFAGQNQKVYAYLFDNANFTEKHCVNKANPEKQCNGACQLGDKQDEEVPAAPSAPEYRALDLFVTNQFEMGFVFFDSEQKKPVYSQQFNELLKKYEVMVPPPNARV